MAESKKITELHQVPSLSDDDEFVVIDKSSTSGDDASATGKTSKVRFGDLKTAVGSQGAPGEKGPQGVQGSKGEKGNTGNTGEEGPAGPPGPSGPQGNSITGPKGPQGNSVTGAKGPQGDSITGPKGQTGEKGPQGDSVTGEKGPQGNSVTGPKGDKGPQGNASVVTDASAITSGVLNAARVPNLDASKITGGELNAARIPLLDPDKIRGTGNLEYTGKVNLYESGKQTTEIHHGGSISMGSDLNSNSFFGVFFSGKPNQSNMLMNPLAIGGANGLIPSGSKLWVNGNVTVNGTVSPAESYGMVTLGKSAVNNRWSVVYANSGDIVTSDQRLKSNIRELSEVEKSVAKKLKSLVRIYQKNDSIEEKGEEKARLHCGVIAQNVKKAFEDEGLNAFRYSILCYDKYYVGKDDNGKTSSVDEPREGFVEEETYSVRYDELLAFIISTL